MRQRRPIAENAYAPSCGPSQSEAHEHERGGDDVDDMVPAWKMSGLLDESRHMAAGRDAHQSHRGSKWSPKYPPPCPGTGRGAHAASQIRASRWRRSPISARLFGDWKIRRAERGQTQIGTYLAAALPSSRAPARYRITLKTPRPRTVSRLHTGTSGHGTGYGSRTAFTRE